MTNKLEYLLLLKPPVEVEEHVNALKNHVAKCYGCEDALKSYPHVTIAKFITSQSMGARLMKIIAIASKSFNKSSLVLNGYQKFNDKTLVIAVEKNAGINSGLAALKQLTKGMFTAHGEKFFSSQLHITIVKNVSKQVFDEIWVDFNDKLYNASFTADELFLFVRQIDAKTHAPLENYSLIDTYRINEKENNCGQLDLL